MDYSFTSGDMEYGGFCGIVYIGGE